MMGKLMGLARIIPFLVCVGIFELRARVFTTSVSDGLQMDGMPQWMV